MERAHPVITDPEVEKKISILIVDDSDYIRERLVELFRDSGFEGPVMEARNSVEAIRLFSSANPDVVILDIRIPGDNGIKTLETMKKMKPDIRVIMLTNYPYEQYKEKCISMGADSFLSKTDDFDKIPFVCLNVTGRNHVG